MYKKQERETPLPQTGKKENENKESYINGNEWDKSNKPVLPAGNNMPVRCDIENILLEIDTNSDSPDTGKIKGNNMHEFMYRYY